MKLVIVCHGAVLAFGIAVLLVGCKDDPLLAIPDAPPHDVPDEPEGQPEGPGACPIDLAGLSAGNPGFLDVGAQTTLLVAGYAGVGVDDGVFEVTSDLGEMVNGPVAVSGDGSYATTVPLFCGTSYVSVSFTAETCSSVESMTVTNSGCTLDDIRATVTWDDQGIDWELHLIRPGGHMYDGVNDCTWTTSNAAEGIALLDWGVLGDAIDDPVKDIDNVSFYGPENITLTGAEPGRYYVLVEHWNPGGSALSDGVLTLQVGGQTHSFTLSDLPALSVMTVAAIDWPSGAVTEVGDWYDCAPAGCSSADPVPAAF